ncbi:hypothetical protein DBR32_04045 [Taibaiella sp. KBW10]|uniref:DUF1634 domain-containing protein n=1 Tax=Taibaiella sp. KBW10 TaxID=2153357 RepID=UPI000F59803E|nr:DUF1634 domain-containing protein [Taibaiella sp. KBW10]RQO31980.1 hypothetical protein DBR32_04045 [Taibaiella sp. KBW10]
MSQFSKRDVQLLVGNTLRIGVWVSMGITLIGIILFLFQNSTKNFDTGMLVAAPLKFSFSELVQGILHGEALSIIQLGVLVLLITPILRIVFALYGYWLEGNRLYIIISLVVLCIIASSLFIGATH